MQQQTPPSRASFRALSSMLFVLCAGKCCNQCTCTWCNAIYDSVSGRCAHLSFLSLLILDGWRVARWSVCSWWLQSSASRNLLIISNRDPESSPEYSEVLYLYGNRAAGCRRPTQRSARAARGACRRARATGCTRRRSLTCWTRTSPPRCSACLWRASRSRPRASVRAHTAPAPLEYKYIAYSITLIIWTSIIRNLDYSVKKWRGQTSTIQTWLDSLEPRYLAPR